MSKHTTNLIRWARQVVTGFFSAGSRRRPRWLRKPTLELLEDRRLLAAAFFAPAEPSGSVNVQLVPLANVTAGTPEVVTFGVPFTRGSVTQAQLSQVRVLKNGVEVPAFVEQLTPWRSIDDAGIDGQSVRVARVQIPYTFTTLSPETITVQWGGPARTLNRPTLQDPRLEWHTVTTGTFVAADNVEEPDVLPLLPKEYLSKGMLDARTDPTNGSVAETRDDPAVMDAMTFTGYREYDHAQKNFFYTIINQNPGITVNYKTDPEPWLYDRTSGMYGLYLRSGFGTALREAVRAADFYADHLDANGFFTLKPGDPKYAYNESLAYTYWLLGDNRMLAPISTVVNAFNGTATRWNPNLSFWTERNVGYKLLANEIAYEVTGNVTFKTSVQTIVGDLIYHQNGANGQLPANRIDGGLYHTGEQHDVSEASSANVLIASSWMSVLIVDPMVRAYGVWQNTQIADFIVRMGNFEKAASKTDGDGQFDGTLRYPDYLMRTDGTSDNRSDTDVQHAMDVGAVAAWATYFAELRGTPDATLRQLANDLYATYDVGVNFWTRPGGTNFNVSPPRRYTWEYKNSPSFSWALTGTDGPAQPGTLHFSVGGYSVNENAGTVTITVTRTGGSAGSVSVSYATSNGSATAGSDYTATSGTLTFADGETTKTFTIPITNDTAVEGDETVNLTLSNPTGGASLGSPASATLTIASDDTTNQPVTVTYQQGVNGYAGTTDASISTQYAQYTGGNGVTSITGTQMGVYQLAGTNGYAVETLIRFSDLGIPSNGTTRPTVTAATLTLSVDTWTANPTIRGYYLAAPWTTAPGTDLGWLHRGTGQDWNTPGARGQGTDVIAGKSFVLPGITGNGQQLITINLDLAVVQSWIDNPSANQGFVLVNETTGAVVRINASENATVGVRPKFSVSYIVGSTTPQAGQLQFSSPTYSVGESGATATITVTRTGGSAGSVTVNYATANGTATAGSDYTATSGTLTFGPGETTKTFTVPITNDAAVEGNETVNLTLSSPTGGATLGTQTTAVLTIQDDDTAQPGTLQFSMSAYTVNENAGTATITVTRTGGSNVPVTVNYATSNGTATAGSDYTATSGTLTFGVGETTKTFTVPIINDALVENPETVTLTLSNPTGGATLGGTATATLTINSDDVALPAVLQFSAAAFTVNENVGTATITITRTGGTADGVSVNYATANGTATAGSDYTATSGTLTFGPGETSKTFTIPILNDTAIENPETVTLTLSSPTGEATLGTPASATLTINSDDTSNQPVTATYQQGVNGYTGTTDVNISTQYAQYTGGNGTTTLNGTQMGVYQLAGTNGYTVESLIRFSNLGITAGASVSGATLTLSVDTWTANPTIRGYYLAAPWNGSAGTNLGWLSRGTGQNWATPGALGQGTDLIAGKSFVLSGIRAIGTQSIIVALDPAVVQSWIDNPNANHGILLVNETTGAVVRINASENTTVSVRPKLSVTYTTGSTTPQPGTFQFSNATYSVSENGTTATITVTRTGGSAGSVTVNYATSNGTATAGSDYTATSGTLTFADGETSKTITVPITNDSAVEGNETVNLTLSNPTGGATLGSQNTAVLTIQDDDLASQFQFNAGSYSLSENGGTLTITVTRTGGTSGTATVQYATSNGTATAGSDYTATSGTLTFGPGEGSKTFTIAVLDDTAVEGNETLTLTLSNPTGATLGSPAAVAVTIVDNDSTPGVSLPAGFTQTVVATGLSSGTALAAAPDGRLFVLEQGGRVRVIKNGTLLSAPALIVNTNAESERGLIGITFDPNFATNPFVYVCYTVGGPSPAPAHNRVSRFTLNGDVAVPGSELVLLDLPDVTTRIHNGGALKFGSDGKLYIAVGNDGVFGNSGSLSNPFGKILRINADGTIPTDNPFYNQTTGVNRAIWAYGLRNPYTFDVQPGSGLMYINDVGEAAWEEINQGVAGANYGWPGSEGYTTNPQHRSPVYAYSHGTGSHQGFAIVGAAFYNPATATFPSQYAGKYFYMDYVNGWIEYVDPTAANPKTPTTFATNIPVRYDGGPVDLEVGTDGALYYLNRLGGGVFKIQYSASAGAPSITQHPTSQTVTQGQPVTFTVAASSTLPVSYQWQRMDSGSSTWVDVSGATAASYTFSTTAADNGDQFRCVVSNSSGSTASNAATLTVTTNTAPSPTITTPTTGALYNAGNTISFSGGATDAEQGNLPPTSLNWWVVFHHDTHTHPFLGSEASPYATGASGSFTIPTSGEVAANQWYRVYLRATDGGGLSTITFRDVNPRVSTFTLATNIPGLSLTLDGQPVASGTATQGVAGMVRTLGAPSGQVAGGKTYNFVSWSDGGNQTHTISTPAANTTYTAVFQEAAPAGTFTKINAASGIEALIAQKLQENPNWWMTGQHLVDLDTDGDLDLFLDSHGGGSPVVALNNGQGVFTRLTTGTWPDTEIHQMYDINGDGKIDLSATYQDGGGRWWINNSTPGNVNFTATNITRGGNTSRAQVMLDFNGDGKVDWLRSEQPGLVIDFGNGTGGFTAGSLSFPIAGTTTNENANFLPGDFDGDGDLDLLILTGGGYDGTLGKTAFWRNNGNLTFTEVSVGLPANGTVVKGIGDFDHDGDIDLIAIENKAMPPVIYLNNGSGTFTKKPGAVSGVGSGTLDYAAWGTAVTTDFDNDGIVDIIMDGKYYLKVLRGTGGGNFTYMNNAWGIKDTAASAVDDGLCFGDIDGDGDLDIIGYNEIYPTRTLNVYRNDLAPRNWLNVRPVGLAGNVGAAGAKIRVYAAGTSQLLWFEQVAQYDFQVATSYYGTRETERHFGLGSRSAVDVEVEFPDGTVRRVNNVTANQTVRILQSAS